MIPLLVVATTVILLPTVNALTARENFDDNHYTYISLGGPKICGDHLCKPGEWNQWIHQLMSHQLKNVKNSIVYTPYENSIKKTAYGDASTLTKTSDGHISQSITEYLGNGQFTSFVSVSNDAVLKINHIELSQQTPGVHIIKAWIGPNWKTSNTPSGVVFDSSGASLDQGQAVNIIIITNGVPAFTIDSLAGR
ncbi:MAG TPA: hypothetical protein VEU72_01700 [Nitrosopumilaceae archaeon]|nr:hypothetical protein [Nitrosopumilaceae archaeon]